MIDKKAILEFMKEKLYKPMTINELEEAFGALSAEEFKDFVKLMNELEENGEIIRTRTNRYGLPDKMNLVKGKLQGNAKGFGFVIPEEKGETDVYVHANDMHGAMNGDTVLVRLAQKASGTRPEGEIVRILIRANQQIVGTFSEGEYYGFVIPDDKRISQDIFIPKAGINGAVEGHKVVVAITKYPEGRMSPEGEVIEILGHKNDPGVDILAIIRKYGLPEAFSDEVLEEAEAIPETISEEEIVNRRDLRNKTIVTIDGEDAKDLDDAVSIERLNNGNYLLGVHIADVTHYVREGTNLDREAFNRGTSVYLVDRVIPMIPHRLSNGICSLNPKVDRLTMSCDMEINAKGEVVKHDIYLSVIRTKERMTYTNVRKILEEETPELMERYQELIETFHTMKELALILRDKRFKRGAIDFDFDESKIIVDEAGKPVDIKKRERSIAEQIIEEFMLAANETVAEHFYWLRIPFLYRVHEEPNPDKLFAFAEFITNFGYVVKGTGNKIHPRALQSLLDEIQDTPEETIISTVMLRSMKQARYDAEPLGHFGLSVDFYSHFTSPIRRYPDLQIHRIIRESIEGKILEERLAFLQERVPIVADHSSERERNAVDAERDTDELKKAEYMLDKIGEEFEGIVSSVASFGMFIELDNSVEGMVHVSFLTDDYYYYHDKQYALIGERTGNIYRIGDTVKVRVVNVNVDEHKIDFEIANDGENKDAARKKRPRLIETKSVDKRKKKKVKETDKKRKGTAEKDKLIVTKPAKKKKSKPRRR